MVSQWFPTWYLENFQDRKIILASYEMDFASKWGARVRDTFLENQDELTMRFATKVPAAHHWETSEGGAMVCAGAGGPITGKGANILIIDDPIKNSDDANSRVMRDKLWDWWTSTARTRIEPFVNPMTRTKVQPAVIVMATRWHSDDLIGRLINPEFTSTQGEREDWEVFVFPAQAEPEAEQHYRQFGVKVNELRAAVLSGKAREARMESIRERLAEVDDPKWRDILGRKRGEALCPDRFGDQELALLRGSSLRDWYAMYQQRPGDEADDGNVYHCFSERANCRTLVKNEQFQLFVSLDFNVDPMCAIIGQYDRGDGTRTMHQVEVLEEVVLYNSNTPSMMEQLLARLRQYAWGYSLFVEFYGDAAGAQRSPNSAKTNWQIVADYLALDSVIQSKFCRKKANPLIADRVNAVNSMLRAADGTVRLFVDDLKCPELVRDFKKVRWAVDPGGNSTGMLDKSDKKRTHISDALGYAVEFNFGLRSKAKAGRGFLQ